MQQKIDYINNVDLFLDRSEEWKLIGYWPKILERVHILDVNMDSILKNQYNVILTHHYMNTIRSPQNNVAISKKTPVQQTFLI